MLLLTSGRDSSTSVVDVGPHERHDRHEGESEAADVVQPEPRA
jgi:hypothetical protein